MRHLSTALSTPRVRFPGLAATAAARGLTLAQVAALLPCSEGHLRAVQHWRRPCSDRFYRRLRAALGCAAGDLQPTLSRAAVSAADPAPASPERTPHPAARRAAHPD